MPITLTPEQENRVKQRVAVGQFNSAEEVLDAALRLVEEASTNGAGVVTAEAADAHPLASLAGKYHSEPLWNELMQAIKENRCEANEQEDAAE